MRDQLKALIDQLRLRGMGEALDTEMERAEKEGVPPSEVLHRLLSQEAAYRQERSLAYRLREAHLPWRWTLDTFPSRGCRRPRSSPWPAWTSCGATRTSCS